MKSSALLKAENKSALVSASLLDKGTKAIPESAQVSSYGIGGSAGFSFGKIKVHSNDMISSSPQRVQPKLTINQPGDKYEQEADAMAEKVMRMPDRSSNQNTLFTPTILAVQRKCAHCEEEEKKIDRKESGTSTTPTTSPAVEQTLLASGQPMDQSTRSFMEERFGHDFGNVRIHNNHLAHQSSEDINARAYTHSNHVVFGSGRYQPDTNNGKQLLAHELVHVLQQVGGGKTGLLKSNLIQRQPATGVHATPPGPKPVLEKWSPDVEAAYRRAGLQKEANAVRSCREGTCQKVLTEKEAWQMFGAGRTAAGLGPPEAGAAPVAAGALAAPSLGGAAAAEGAVVKTAAERAALRWGMARGAAGIVTTVAEGGALAAEGTAAAAAAPAAGATITIAAPVALGVFVVVAVIALVSWSRFQKELESHGYVILPSPLAVCIGNCHQPAAPTFKSRPRLFDDLTSSPPWGPGKISEDDIQKLKDWLGPEASRGKPQQQPTPQPVSPPQPASPPKSQKCTDELVEKLNKKMHESCNKERGCSMQGDNCTSATAKVAAGYGCVRERTELQQKCFGKDDDGYEEHMRKIAESNKTLQNCLAVMSAKCG